MKTIGFLRKGHLRLILCLAIGVASLCATCSIAFADEVTDPEPENGIPLVIIRVDESAVSIDDMNNSGDHSVRCQSATIEVKLPENYQAKEGYTTDVPQGKTNLKYIRGRGNSTWDCRKKPYKVELNTAEDFFGMGASTDWALLANAFDTSMMRNRIIFWLGQKMELPFTPQLVPVDLVMIGDKTGVHELGSYCLSETIKIEENRINIGKLKKKDTENITGGYLMATYTDQDGGEDPSTWFTTNYGVDVYNDSPDFLIEEGKELTQAQLDQRQYIRSYVQELENLIMKAEMKNGKITEAAHQKIAEKMDLQSAADFWLLQEIPFNTDGYATPSTYFYKARDGKLCWGPLWDFDYAFWNNDIDPDQVQQTFNNTSMLWIDHLREYDPYFASLLKERWAVLNESMKEATEKDGIIDQYELEIRDSRQADYDIWKIGEAENEAYAAATETVSKDSFNGNIEKMRTWIDKRRAWAEANKDDMGQVYCTAVYMAEGKPVATELVRYDTTPVLDPDVQAPEGYVLEGWKKGRKLAKDVKVTEDTVFKASFIEESKAKAPEKLDIFIPDLYMKDGQATADVSSEFFPGSIQQGTYKEDVTLDFLARVEPYNATNPRITWTSSNENVATIDPVKHKVVLKAGGDITITGTLYNGVSASFKLHVTGPEPAPVSKLANPLKVTGKTAKVKFKKIKKKKQTLAVGKVMKFTGDAKDKKTYSLSSAKKGKKSFKKYFKINKTTGKVTVKKGLKKGTYKVRVNVKAAGNEKYEASGNVAVTFKVKVK